MNKLVSFGFWTQVSIWFLISMKVFTRIGIKKKREKGVCVCVWGGGGGGGGRGGG